MDDTVYKFTVPMPHKILSPNSLKAHRSKSPFRAAYRKAVALLYKQQLQGPAPKLKHVRMDLTWVFKLKRGHDASNLICWFKAGQDALEDAEIIQNDRFLIPMPCQIVFDSTIEKNVVHVEIQEVDPKEFIR